MKSKFLKKRFASSSNTEAPFSESDPISLKDIKKQSYELIQKNSVNINEINSTNSLNSLNPFIIYERRKRKFREDEMEKKFKHKILNAAINYLNYFLPDKFEILSGAIADETNAFFNFILLNLSLKVILSTPNTEKWGKKWDNNINVIKEIYNNSSSIENKDKIKEILNSSLIDIINHCRNKNRKEIGFLKGLESCYNETKEKICKKQRLDYMAKYNELESSVYKYYQQKLIKSIKKNAGKLYDISNENGILFIKYSIKKKIKNNNLQKFFNKIYSYKLKIDEKIYLYLDSNNQKKEEDNEYIDLDNPNFINIINTDNQEKEDDRIDYSNTLNLINIVNNDNQEKEDDRIDYLDIQNLVDIQNYMNIINNDTNYNYFSTNLSSAQNNQNNDESFSYNDGLISVHNI